MRLSPSRDGVTGPVFIECAIDLLYDEGRTRQWYADAAGKADALGERLLRLHLNRRVASMFTGSGEAAQIAAAVTKLGIAVHMSCRARGLLGRDHRLKTRHQRRLALRAADCSVIAGAPLDLWLDWGWLWRFIWRRHDDRARPQSREGLRFCIARHACGFDNERDRSEKRHLGAAPPRTWGKCHELEVDSSGRGLQHCHIA